MSKSLGNVIDPVDTIEQFGTDALRFTLATGTAPGQDLNLSLDRITAMRNFTNKIWNAGKYILFNLEKVSDDEWRELGSGGPVTASELRCVRHTSPCVSAAQAPLDRRGWSKVATSHSVPRCSNPPLCCCSAAVPCRWLSVGSCPPCMT